MDNKSIEYLFVFDGSWWLKITELEQIIDYHKQTENRYEGAINLHMRMKQEGMRIEDLPTEERIKMIGDKDFQLMQAAIIKARQVEGSILDGFRCLNMEMGMAELDTIKKYGAVYINKAGGHTHGIEYSQFCRRKFLVFPDYKKEEIRVRQFNGGRHWYAYIEDIQVRNGDELKWDTKEEAQAAAETMITA